MSLPEHVRRYFSRPGGRRLHSSVFNALVFSFLHFGDGFLPVFDRSQLWSGSQNRESD